jgi:hypothetical protein
LYKPIKPSWIRSSGIAPCEEVRARLQADETGIAANEPVERRLVAVSGAHHQLQVGKLALLSLNGVRWG